MLGFMERLTLQPMEVGADHVQQLRAAGLDDEAIEEAVHICVQFNIIDRLADAFEFELMTDDRKEAFVQASLSSLLPRLLSRLRGRSNGRG